MPKPQIARFVSAVPIKEGVPDTGEYILPRSTEYLVSAACDVFFLRRGLNCRENFLPWEWQVTGPTLAEAAEIFTTYLFRAGLGEYALRLAVLI